MIWRLTIWFRVFWRIIGHPISDEKGATNCSPFVFGLRTLKPKELKSKNLKNLKPKKPKHLKNFFFEALVYTCCDVEIRGELLCVMSILLYCDSLHRYSLFVSSINTLDCYTVKSK